MIIFESIIIDEQQHESLFDSIPPEVLIQILQRLSDRLGLLRQVHPLWMNLIDTFFPQSISKQSEMHVLLENPSLFRTYALNDDFIHKNHHRISEKSIMKSFNTQSSIAPLVFPPFGTNPLDWPVVSLTRNVTVAIQAAVVGDLEYIKTWMKVYELDPFMNQLNDMRQLTSTLCLDSPLHVFDWFTQNHLWFIQNAIPTLKSCQSFQDLCQSSPRSLIELIKDHKPNQTFDPNAFVKFLSMCSSSLRISIKPRCLDLFHINQLIDLIPSMHPYPFADSSFVHSTDPYCNTLTALQQSVF